MILGLLKQSKLAIGREPKSSLGVRELLLIEADAEGESTMDFLRSRWKRACADLMARDRYGWGSIDSGKEAARALAILSVGASKSLCQKLLFDSSTKITADDNQPQGNQQNCCR